MSDGREEREEQKLRREQEKQQDRRGKSWEEQTDREEPYEGEPERGGS